MKKIIIALAFVLGTTIIVSAQNVVIQQNTTAPSTTQTTGHEYHINGISTAEDIGGVDVAFVCQSYGTKWSYYRLKFTNYHEYTVRVLYELPGGIEGSVYGSITLRANETKEAPSPYAIYTKQQSIITIVRKL